MPRAASFFCLVCGMLLLGYFGRIVWQCGLSIVIVLYYTCTNVFILMLALASFVAWYWMGSGRTIASDSPVDS